MCFGLQAVFIFFKGDWRYQRHPEERVSHLPTFLSGQRIDRHGEESGNGRRLGEIWYVLYIQISQTEIELRFSFSSEPLI